MDTAAANPAVDTQPPPLAIVGMAMRLPGGVRTDEDLWKALLDKICTSSEIPKDRYRIDGFHGLPGTPGTICSRQGHFLDEDISRFDAEFFSIPSQELHRMDPQQRLLLEVVWECMENAGQVNWQGSQIGCYVGTFAEDWLDLTNKDPQFTGQGRVGGSGDFAVANRVSYQFNLDGPSLTVRTACSSTLVGLDIACNAIRSGACSSAIVAGTSLIMTPTMTIAMSEEGVLSPTGTSKTFDAAADGYARGEAINAIYIKKLDDALRNRDPIRAVIRATATNSDGKTMGMTTPSPQAQARVIRQAHRIAHISDVSQTGYIECHGTGTTIGDPMEAAAVADVKANFGHSEGASGITSVIKATLALEHGQVPPNALFTAPNPKIPFAAAKLQVPTKVLPWPADRMKRASVNSFGIGGVNAHVILESPTYYVQDGKPTSKDHEREQPYLLVVSGNCKQSLEARVHDVQRYMSGTNRSLADVAYTLGLRREHMRYRAFGVVSHGRTHELSIANPGKASTTSPRMAFVFTGQGAQWPGMASELIKAFPVFRASIEALDTALQALYRPPSWSILEQLCATEGDARMSEAELAQPLSTALQIALVDLLSSWGIRADAVVGHSSGEIAAAYAAGALTARDAILVSFFRGRAMKHVSRNGAMAAVGMGAEEIQQFLGDHVGIACVNSPRSITLSGDKGAVVKVMNRINSAQPEVFSRILNVPVAYHSNHMKDAGGIYQGMLEAYIEPAPVKIPFYSSVTGELHKNTSVSLGPSYWRKNLESPVLFSPAVNALQDDGEGHILLEIGPHSTLAGPLREIAAAKNASNRPLYVPTMVREKDQLSTLLSAAGQVHCSGGNIDFAAVNGSDGRVITDIPLYPWQHEVSYWEESRVTKDWRLRQQGPHELLGSLVLESNEREPVWRNMLRLEDVPWLNDHRVGGDVVFPGAAYIAMAGEAVRRITTSSSCSAYKLRRVVIANPLLLSDSTAVELMTSLRPAKLTDLLDSSWFEFTISSLGKDAWTRHCSGLVQGVEHPVRPPASYISPKAFVRKIKSEAWYHKLQNLGMDYGPEFRRLQAIRADPLLDTAVATVRHDGTDLTRRSYPIHPSVIDQCLQLQFVAACRGRFRHFDRAALPNAMEEVYIAPVASGGLHLEASVTAASSDTLQGQVSGQSNGQGCIQMSGCNFSFVDLGEDDTRDRMGAAKAQWLPHIDHASPGTLIRGLPDTSTICLLEKLAILCSIESLRQIESVDIDIPYLCRYRDWLSNLVNRIPTDEYTVLPEAKEWLPLEPEFRLSLISDTAERLKETLGTPYAKAAVSVFDNLQAIVSGTVQPLEVLSQEDILAPIYESANRGIDFDRFFRACGHSHPTLRVLEIGAGTGAFTAKILDSLVMPDGLRMYSSYTFTDISPGFFAPARKRFSQYACIDYQALDIGKDPLEQGFRAHQYDLIVASNALHATPSLHATLCHVHQLLAPNGRIFLQELSTATNFTSYIMGIMPDWWVGCDDGRSSVPFVSAERWNKELQRAGFTGIDAVIYDDQPPYHLNAHIVSRPTPSISPPTRVNILTSSKDRNNVVHSVLQSFEKRGYSASLCTLDDDPLPPGPIISLLDVDGPFFNEMNASKWNHILRLVSPGHDSPILWLTRGCQLHSPDPRYALVLGFARTLRLELSIDFLTLEIPDWTINAFNQVVGVYETFSRRKSTDSGPDYEYYLLDDCMHVPRYLPFTPSEGDSKDLALLPGPRHLGIEKRGQLDSLSWVGGATKEVLNDDEVEVSVKFAGLNFKDVLVAMGLVPGEKTDFGTEGAGVVTRVGLNVKRLQPGDRVMVFNRVGCLSTSLVVSEELCAAIPDALSFKDAASMGTVFVTVIHSLMNLAGLETSQGKTKQSVLIHSACGGVGLAAIQICQMASAEIYATVGNDEKVRFLTDRCGIPKDRIYHSRNDSFADRIMHDTQGRGVDIVLNSLSGELLHASWKCVAKYGTMVELGKRDFLGHGALSMHEFDNNRSFCGVDVAQMVVDRPDKAQRLLERCVALYQEGHISPLPEIKVFEAAEIQQAFRYMQRGQNIGKTVIQMPEDPMSLTVSRIQASKPLFTAEHAYLLVGGVGGLGRAIAFWMVENGARYLVFLSRSAGRSLASEEFFDDLRRQGCIVTAVAGSVAEYRAVECAVSSSPKPIAGVVQCSMVVEDQSVLEMSEQDWDAAVTPKVKGTWNLHKATTDHHLDFFLLISSIVGLAGNFRQANYAAANSFLDSFVVHRRSLGLPASVIDVGFMDEVGILSEHPPLLERFKAKGVHLLREQDLLDAVEISIVHQQTQLKEESPKASSTSISQLPIGFIFRDKQIRGAPWENDIRLSVHKNIAIDADPATEGSGKSRLQSFLISVAANPAILQEPSSLELLTKEVLLMLCTVMSLQESHLNKNQTIFSLGIDSLVKVEIRKWWKKNLGLDINVLELGGMGTIEDLARSAVSRLQDKYQGSLAGDP